MAAKNHWLSWLCRFKFVLLSLPSISMQTTFQIWRVDGNQWGQGGLAVDFLVLRDDKGPLAGINGQKEFGSDKVGTSSSRCTSATVTFSKVS